MKNFVALSLLFAGGALAAPASVVEVGNSLEKRVANLERMLQGRNRVQIEMQQHLDALQQELNELRGVSETHSYKLNQMLERQRELYKEIDKRLAQRPAPQTTTPAIPVPTPSPVLPAAGAEMPSESAAYDRALSLVLKDKRYDQAIPEFSQFIATYPNSAYAANAHYWLGQLLYNKGVMDKANEQFLTLADKYPDSSKRGDALVKLGMIAQKQNQLSQAKAYYQQVLNEYPDKSVAQIASARLNSLGN